VELKLADCAVEANRCKEPWTVSTVRLHVSGLLDEDQLKRFKHGMVTSSLVRKWIKRMGKLGILGKSKPILDDANWQRWRTWENFRSCYGWVGPI
jgi:hypothetical protein